MNNVQYIMDDKKKIKNIQLDYNQKIFELYATYIEALKQSDYKRIDFLRKKIEKIENNNE